MEVIWNQILFRLLAPRPLALNTSVGISVEFITFFIVCQIKFGLTRLTRLDSLDSRLDCLVASFISHLSCLPMAPCDC